MPWPRTLSREQQIALVLFIFALWCGISWRWYTCGIKGFCSVPQTAHALVSPVKDVPLIPLVGTEASAAGAVPCAAYLTKDLALGKKNDRTEVRKLEQFLRAEGAPLAEDGIFGRNDATEVKRYQERWRALGIVPDGVVSEKTRELINRAACDVGGVITH